MNTDLLSIDEDGAAFSRKEEVNICGGLVWYVILTRPLRLASEARSLSTILHLPQRSR